MVGKLFVLLQYCVPQQALSRFLGNMAESETRWFKNLLISLFVKVFKVDMSEAAQENKKAYSSFNNFFTRELKTNARPLCTDVDAIASPADGTISQLGDIEHGKIFQAKGKDFDIAALLGGDEYLSQDFVGGKFMTVYLSPKDYHRVHMPMDAQLQSMVHVPGKLFSVNGATAEGINDLFARNERVACVFDTNAGPMAVIMVGAMIVASIETIWAGVITPVRHHVRTFQYPDETTVQLAKGEEMGQFKLGSTAIVLMGPDMAEWSESLTAGSKVRMGEHIGVLINA